jgi:hypothetical protein
MDEISTVPRGKVRERIGQVDTATMQVEDQAPAGFLGLG